MDTVISLKPLMILLATSMAPLPIIVFRKSLNLREGCTFLAAGFMFLLVASMLPGVLEGAQYGWTVFEVLPRVPIAFKVDAFGLLFALVSSLLWIVTSLYSMGYMRSLKEHGQTRYYCFFSLSLFATMGAAFSANLLTLYLFYELLSLFTYPLVAHHQDAEARQAGRKYLFYLMGASIVLVLPAILYVYSVSGSLDFSVEGILAGRGSSGTLTIVLLLFVFGFAKAALMPLHGWLPNAMVAPTPVSALLHAVAVVKVGVFSILRVLTGTFGMDLLGSLSWGGLSASTLLAAIASFTLIASALIALSQDNLKRVLAFSTVGQLAYIVLAVALACPKGTWAGMAHIAFHAFGKITLFFCAGAIFVASGKKNISQLSGLGRRMPVTMGAFLIGVLSVIGLPPTAGFISKWYLILGTLETDQLFFLVIVLAGSLLKAGYFFPIVFKAFFGKPGEESEQERNIREAPLPCLVPLVFTALISLFLFFYPQPVFDLADLAVDALFLE